MANIIVKILGKDGAQDKSAETVGELKSLLGLSNHSASVNGSAQENDFSLSDGQLVTFSTAVKGGQK